MQGMRSHLLAIFFLDKICHIWANFDGFERNLGKIRAKFGRK